MTYSFFVWMFIVALVVIVGVTIYYERNEIHKTSKPMTFGSVFVIFFVTMGLLIAGLFPEVARSEGFTVELFLSDPSTLFLAVVCSVFMYWCRGKEPFAYGLLEIVVGIGTISLVLFTATGDLLARLFGILGGGYIIVRGMDNADKGLPASLRKAWDAAFPKKIPKPS